MNFNKKRGDKIYFISDHEYILLPLQVQQKTFINYNISFKKNQVLYERRTPNAKI